ncbi:MAG: hypothetical protein CVU99_01380 [Firmicutes bacterium HGW-Firmicutes-4]|jgi:hypothetical protein|nr:MAG: hypothetical protein CVU99_01380 [Firmicutes bacterium HGW-Firmicutes-4]
MDQAMTKVIAFYFLQVVDNSSNGYLLFDRQMIIKNGEIKNAIRTFTQMTLSTSLIAELRSDFF